ncbi:EmrB/QacA subfamily drug resistance transporter [Actinoplanes octamycinicus]|uniref:EmrB/QacA subfamily drug resistance transporter n=1 Tax=Actinoplanes octamycinicus TaxID=135948 RepID=A0A7W7MCN6_9ACTN|nr:DHA2 family efflux MFS transporter permease subunit [Actinoplanes octamycinicus]MBB4745005.1 EmrB/QacA subfamily drug resistance transporter [Actinoplanes octamycinicus]GIE55592.1 MFS transporter [Actinoplanes octamycinicus]
MTGHAERKPAAPGIAARETAAASDAAPETAAPKEAGSPRLSRPAQLGLMIGPVLTMVDSSIVNVAVADIARELHATLDGVQWVVSGYLLALAAGLAASAYLARRFGTLRTYRMALIGFVAASAACAVAPTVPLLITARAAQGLLGAPLVPLAMTLLLGRQGAARRIPIAAGLLFFLAPALGPTLGGLLVATGGWPWIFLVNVPVGVAGLLGLRRVPAGAAAPADPGARFDPIGLTLLAAGLTAVLYGVSRAPLTGWLSPVVIGTVSAGLALLAGYLWWASRRAQPAVDLALVRYAQSRLALTLSVVSSVVAYAAVFLLPVFTQAVQGHSTLATGLALLPQGLITGVGTALGQRLATRIPVRTLVTGGFLVLGATSAGLLLLQADTPLGVTAIILSGRAVAIGFGITPLLFAMLAPLGDGQLADGNTIFNIAQRLGGALGVSLLATLYAAQVAATDPVTGFHHIGVILTGVALGAALLALRLAPIRQPSG